MPQRRGRSSGPVGGARPALVEFVEFEYRRGGTLAYLAAWDVHDADLDPEHAPSTSIVDRPHLISRVKLARRPA